MPEMNVSKILTKDYENETLGEHGEKSQNKPDQTQNKANSNPIQTQFKPKTNPISDCFLTFSE